ncbi:PREDICTED: vesicle-associated protein 2-2-like [Fragaria vesca subsp. vesca]|uniref:vesicle-associated protein 2-2-like n=1 Tax=Fragaria vesca subsp. vesca TaxID=101020 RepID=UPI0002C35152|nr:PREDICTED: vesicle-associated protein 2-2-like [Fragaria vesca subsp. vesca]
MITTELLDVQPNELQFTFEVKKQSTCTIQLGNRSDQCVAFKVKTTSPKKYCVRPNTGIIKPRATCDFTVTMQAQKVAPPELQCKDKFLIQCTVIPFGISEEEVTSDMFAKDSGKYVEEKKLRVVLTSPPPFPEFLHVNGEPKEDLCYETSAQKDRVLNEVEYIPPPQRVADNVDGESYKDESRAVMHAEELKPEKNAVVLNLAKDLEELKSKLSTVNLKLKEADLTIIKLTEEKRMTTREKNMLKHESELLSKKNNARSIMVGFPLLYIFLVALISIAIGYFAHP